MITIDDSCLYNSCFPFIKKEFDGNLLLSFLLKRKKISIAKEEVLFFFNKIYFKENRNIEFVKKQYDSSWLNFNYNKYDINNSRQLDIISWGDKYVYMNINGIARIHLLCIKKIIDCIEPSSIAEIGFGSGNKLLPLSKAFPKKKIGGVELSDSGFTEVAKNIGGGILPKELQLFSPFSIENNILSRDIDIFQCSANNLPFPDKSYDLIYTSQALEQMESIRDEVLFEISRVAKRYVVMIEPFRDWNQNGLRRIRIKSRNYFQAWISDLAKYGMKPIYIKENIPTKISMRVGIVVAEIC